MALNTRQKLAESLKRLLSKKPLDKITVTELVADCGINRQTFYYNFQDIYALVEWLFTQESVHVVSENFATGDLHKAHLAIYNYMSENRELVMNTYHAISRVSIEKFLRKVLRPHITELVDSISTDKSLGREDRAFIISIFTTVLISMAFEWLDNDMRYDYKPHIERFDRILDSSLRNLIAQFSD